MGYTPRLYSDYYTTHYIPYTIVSYITISFSDYYTMIRLLVWWCVIYSCVTMVFSSSIDTEYSDEYYDDYLYSQEQEEEQSEAISLIPKSRVLFDDDEVNEQTDSSAVNFSTKDDKLDLNRKISFSMPEERLSNIEMTLRELNEIFDKKNYMRDRERK